MFFHMMKQPSYDKHLRAHQMKSLNQDTLSNSLKMDAQAMRSSLDATEHQPYMSSRIHHETLLIYVMQSYVCCDSI